MLNQQPKYQLSKGEQLVNTTLTNAAKKIKEKYDIKPCGTGAAMPGGPFKSSLCVLIQNILLLKND